MPCPSRNFLAPHPSGNFLLRDLCSFLCCHSLMQFGTLGHSGISLFCFGDSNPQCWELLWSVSGCWGTLWCLHASCIAACAQPSGAVLDAQRVRPLTAPARFRHKAARALPCLLLPLSPRLRTSPQFIPACFPQLWLVPAQWQLHRARTILSKSVRCSSASSSCSVSLCCSCLLPLGP